jgi:hypothetical protein
MPWETELGVVSEHNTPRYSVLDNNTRVRVSFWSVFWPVFVAGLALMIAVVVAGVVIGMAIAHSIDKDLSDDTTSISSNF